MNFHPSIIAQEGATALPAPKTDYEFILSRPNKPLIKGQGDRQPFDIRNHLDRLTATKERNRYICPVCDGNNLSVEAKTGKYRCWSGCECEEIREAICPWDEVKKQKAHSKTPILKRKKRPSPPPTPSIEKFNLIRLNEPASDRPSLQSPVFIPGKQIPNHTQEIQYPYSANQKVFRFQWTDETKPKGYDKTFRQWHRNESGQIKWSKGNDAWPAYRISEAIQAAQKAGNQGFLLVQEGEECVEEARANAIASVCVQGSEKFKTLIEQVKAECPGLALAYLRDEDATGIKKSEQFQKECDEAGILGIVINPIDICPGLPEKGDIVEILGIMSPDDFITKLEEEIQALYQARQELEYNLSLEVQPAKSATKQRYLAVEGLWGDRLRFNNLKQQIELDGKPVDLDLIALEIALELDIAVPREEAIAIITRISKANQYNPVVEYLQEVHAKNPNPGMDLSSLAARYFGSGDSTHASYFRRHLIAAVARAMEPGCKADTVLILQGNQGYKKSSFFRLLHGADWFDDTMANVSDKDQLLKLHRFWVAEWAELENVFSRKHQSHIKAFLTTQADSYRPPYGREPKTFPRRSIIVGTTNRDDFLSDPTGDRRYWVIPVAHQIDLELLKKERDRIWAAAYQAYLSGEQWHLTEDEQALSNQLNEDFRSEDVWTEYISNYLAQINDFVTTAEILTTALEIDKNRQDVTAQRRIATIMRMLGWHPGRGKKGGNRVRGWLAPGTKEEVSVQVSVPSVQVSVHPPNPHPASDSPPLDRWDIENSEKNLNDLSNVGFKKAEPEKNSLKVSPGNIVPSVPLAGNPYSEKNLGWTDAGTDTGTDAGTDTDGTLIWDGEVERYQISKKVPVVIDGKMLSEPRTWDNCVLIKEKDHKVLRWEFQSPVGDVIYCYSEAEFELQF